MRNDSLHIINQESVRLQLLRGDVCSLLIALDAVADATNGKKWPRIRDEIREQLDKHDARQDEKAGIVKQEPSSMFITEMKELHIGGDDK